MRPFDADEDALAVDNYPMIENCRLFYLLILIAAALGLSGCADMQQHHGKCYAPPESIRKDQAIETLDAFSEMMQSHCYQEALQLGRWIRKNLRDKEYSVSNEVFSVFVPEESATQYVLESYERAYLAFMMSSAYLGLGKKDDAAVELRKSYSEGKAILYNYGEDPVNLLLLAAMWDNLGESDSARPFWKKLSEQYPDGDPLNETALKRISDIDAHKPIAKPWSVFGVGRFPKLDWSLRFGGSNYKVIKLDTIPGRCGSPTGARVDVSSWVDKISLRYSPDYHPLLHVKSWVRMPIGLAYGVTTFGAGLGVMLTGCMVDGKNHGAGILCRASMEAGGYLMAKSGDVTGYALKPDLRHWTQVPAAVVVTQNESIDEEPCFQSITQSYRPNFYRLVEKE